MLCECFLPQSCASSWSFSFPSLPPLTRFILTETKRHNKQRKGTVSLIFLTAGESFSLSARIERQDSGRGPIVYTCAKSPQFLNLICFHGSVVNVNTPLPRHLFGKVTLRNRLFQLVTSQACFSLLPFRPPIFPLPFTHLSIYLPIHLSSYPNSSHLSNFPSPLPSPSIFVCCA